LPFASQENLMGQSAQKPQIIPVWNNLPAELCALDQWVLWRWEQRKDKNGQLKWTKPPYQPSGKKAENDEPATWTTFNQVRAALANGGKFSGIGPVFSETDPFAGLDCDHCLDAQLQIIDPQVAWIVQLLDTYTEVSPSRDGLKMWARGKKPGARCSVKASFGEIALYDKERFFTITGEVWPPGSDPKPIAHRQAELETIYQTLFPKKATVKKQPTQTSPLKLDDAQLLELARKAKDGAKFIALYDRGDTSSYGNDDSRADAALCLFLAFWTSRNAARMDSLFRRSALMRDKWDRDDYRKRTIEYAIDQCDEIYTPPPPLPDEPEYVQAVGNTLIIDDAEGNGPPPPLPPNGPAQGQPPPPGDLRPTIRIVLGDAPDKVNEAEAVLLKHAEALRIFQRLGTVIKVISLCGDELAKQQKRTGLKLPEGQVVLDPLPTIAIVETFERLIHWLRFDRRANKWFSADCPKGYAERYLARRGGWRLPYLAGVIEAPLLVDGRVLREPGYDRETRLYLATKEDWPELPEWTNTADAWEDARNAARRLLAPFAEFPFVKPAHRAVFLTAILTVLQRRQLNFAPLHAFSAHMQRTGKSLLAEAVGVLNKPTLKGKWQCRCKSAKSTIVGTLSLSLVCGAI
jgi:hypothetical protein